MLDLLKIWDMPKPEKAVTLVLCPSPPATYHLRKITEIIAVSWSDRPYLYKMNVRLAPAGISNMLLCFVFKLPRLEQ